MAFSHLIFLSVYPILVKATQTDRGHPRIHHDGYTYGLKNMAFIHTQEHNTWNCTRTGVRPNGTSGRCLAKIETKIINGSLMMRSKDPNHMCNKNKY